MNLDEKYILQLTTRFPKLSKTSKGSYSCRCGFCGDSEKPYKKSASFYLAGGTGPHFNFICFRNDCNKRISLKNLLKELEPKLYEAYMDEVRNDTASVITWEKFKQMQNIQLYSLQLSDYDFCDETLTHFPWVFAVQVEWIILIKLKINCVT